MSDKYLLYITSPNYMANNNGDRNEKVPNASELCGGSLGNAGVYESG